MPIAKKCQIHIHHFIHLKYLPFLFPEIAQLFQNYSLSFKVPIILGIVPAYFVHP